MPLVVFTEASPRWWNLVVEGKSGAPPGKAAADEARKRARELLAADTAAWDKLKKKSEDGDDRYMKQVLKSGTMADKVAAMTLLVQESPVHRLSVLDNLMALALTKEQRTSRMAVESLKDLFVNHLLPDGRRLRPMEQQPLSGKAEPLRLIVGYFEEQVRTRYLSLVQMLQQAMRDTVQDFKRFALDTAVDLLARKPEQEAALLAMVVNKLGDPDRKTASRAAGALRTLLRRHGAMTAIVVREVQSFLMRTNLNSAALHAAVAFLNQTYLRRGETELAASLVRIYFGLFKRCVAEGGAALESRLLSALLTGVNRALPYHGSAASARAALAAETDVLFKITHTSPFATRVQALSLIHQLVRHGAESSTKDDDNLGNRFYTALYAQLHSPGLRALTKPTLFLNLVHRAMKADHHKPRVVAFAKRLLQIGGHVSAAFAAAALFLVSALVPAQPQLADIVSAASVGSTRPRPSEASEQQQASYDAFKREPRFAISGEDVDDVPAWELALMLHHYHPSVQHFTRGLLVPPEHAIKYSGDPLTDFTAKHFLDRFSYRNPKNRKNPSEDAGGALPARGPAHSRARSGVGAAADEPVNSESFLARPRAAIADDEVFYRRFFEERARREGSAQRPGTVDEKLAESEARVHGGGVGAEDEDPELEAFATKLAEKLMRDSGHGVADFDDEDPDTSGWNEADGDEDSDEDEDEAESGGAFREAGRGELGNDDDFMDDDDDDDEDDEDDGFGVVDRQKKNGRPAGDDDGFMDEDDDDDEDDDGDEDEGDGEDALSGDASDGDDEDMAALMGTAAPHRDAPSAGKRKRVPTFSGGAFASETEVTRLLAASGQDDGPRKQIAWEEGARRHRRMRGQARAGEKRSAPARGKKRR